jgi:hypothetical protein
MVPQHGPFSLHTMLEGMLPCVSAFPTHMVRPLDESQGSSPLQGHNSWLMFKVALIQSILKEELNQWVRPLQCVHLTNFI